MANSKTKGVVKKILIGLLLLLVLIQFFHPAKNINTGPMPQDIAAVYPMPDSVHRILQTSCYDCHSNNTAYPWYNNIQPVAWWLNDHVEEGKRELNFSEFGTFKTKRKLKKLKEIVSEVEEGEMPLSSYTIIHTNAVLSAREKELIIQWAKGLTQQITMQPGVQE